MWEGDRTPPPHKTLKRPHTHERPMKPYHEIQTFGMITQANGDCISAESVGAEPEFFDVLVTQRWPDGHPKWGDVEIVEEHENLNAIEAAEIEDKLFAKYPDAFY